MTFESLHSGWTLHIADGPAPADLPAEIPAIVPGVVHTDLLAAGLIADPYLDRNETLTSWIGETDVEYRTRFTWSADDRDRVDLVALGLDTVAELELNGIAIGSTRNQHRSYRFDVRDSIREGENDLVVRFAAPLRFAREAEARMGPRPVTGNPLPYNAMRKMACNFGWDWGPVLLTSGIWRPIGLERWSTARLDSVRPHVTVDEHGTGRVVVEVDIERAAEGTLRAIAQVTGPNSTYVTRSVDVSGSTARLELEVADVQLWWPVGHGEHPLYGLEISLEDAGGAIDSWSREIGFRTVELRMNPDEFGTSFEFLVNGRPIWVKGVNWIPDDCFPSRIRDEDYAAGVQDALDAGCNLLRIWGGGLYESDALYSACDRAGLMVWQDFLFACAAYAEDAELWDEVAAEARENIVRLAPHPSLVFWNGSNENIEGFYEWGWQDHLTKGQSWGRGYYDELLPRLVAELDGTRPYTPSSPFSPTDYANPRDPDNGSVHSWEVWNRKDYSAYADVVPRFVAEFGFQGPPAWSTLTGAVHDDPLTAESPGILAHQKAMDGNEKLRVGYEPHLPEPTSFDDWHYTTQLNQAHAIRFGVEHFRSHWPRTTGTVLWQLNDCWPVISWSAVDSARRRKPLWYALRALNAPRLLTIQPRDGGLALIACNDHDERWAEDVEVVRRGFDGVVVDSAVLTIDAAPRSNASVSLPVSFTEQENAANEAIVARSSKAPTARHYFAPDRDLRLPAADVRGELRRVDGGYELDLTAQTWIKDLVLVIDRLDADARVDDQMITLEPGESWTLRIASDTELGLDDLLTHPVLQTVNRLLVAALSTSEA